ncbi:Hypothetical protein HDN1F_21470 [gamma proteobacterium HdN1]|nr:Hypothetical protein HDN1F_21470 [gamma proteobacterium HdN1]
MNHKIHSESVQPRSTASRSEHLSQKTPKDYQASLGAWAYPRAERRSDNDKKTHKANATPVKNNNSLQNKNSGESAQSSSAHTALVYSNLLNLGMDRFITLVEDLHKIFDNFSASREQSNDQPVGDAKALTALRHQRINQRYQFLREINNRLGLAIAELLGALEHRGNIKFLTHKDED